MAMQAPAPIPRGSAAVAGVVAGGMALGATEFFAGLVAGAPSVVLAIGDLLISLQPPGVKQLVVDLFGTADKDVLNVAVAVGALVLSAWFGVLGARSRRAAALAFAGLGGVGLLAALRQPLTSAPLAVVSAALGVGFAMVTLNALLGAAVPPINSMPNWSRRRFLERTALLAAVGVSSGVIGRTLLNARAAAPVGPGVDIPAAVDPVPALPGSAQLPVPGITPVVTPNESFYRIDTALLVPRVNAATWQLRVTGMVDSPLTLTYADLLAMPFHEQYVTIACVSNEVGGDLVGNALWKGVRLREVLDLAGVRPGASQVVGRSVDGWTSGFPTAWLDEPGREALVALAMNGEPLPAAHGFPARLIVPGLFGYVSATKWLAEIELTTWDAFDAYWVPLGWSKEGPILTQARIDLPRANATVGSGEAVVAGVAWAPDRGVSRVEVQIDGEDWIAAELSAPISDATWVQWRATWTAAVGDHAIRVRATDGTGETQTSNVTSPAPDGARGYHTIGVSVA